MVRRCPVHLLATIALVLGCGSSGDGAATDDGGADWITLEDGMLGPPGPGAPAPSSNSSITYPPLPPQPTVGDAGPDTYAPVDAARDSSPVPDTSIDDAPIDSGLVCTDTTLDVDGVTGNGCEVTDPQTNRSEAATAKLAVLGACTPYATISFDLISDARTHTPSGATGAAPVYWSFFEDTSCALGTKPTLGLFSVAAGAPGSYEVVLYPSGGAPDPKCTGVVHGGESVGPITCAAPVSGKAYLRIRKLDGAPGTAHVTFKVR